MKNVLILSAHTDDDILGAGGAIQYFKEGKYKIYVCQVTDGCSSQYGDNPKICKERNQQYQKAMKFLKVDGIFNLDFPDMQLDTIPHFQINQDLNKIFKKTKPEILLTHSPDDINKDHQEIYKSTLVIIRPLNNFLKRVYSYETLSCSEWNPDSPFKPNYFIDIKKYLAKKKEAFGLLKTELREYPHSRSLEGIEILAKYRGLQCGRRYAEAFRLIKGYD